jgi:tetratricopeptide (TPR) repeat protein/predicted Ser/Thr protein kinase
MSGHPRMIAPEALRPQVEGDFANERVKQAIMANLFDEPLAPAKIGRFTVLRELGRGGTGVVYAAYDEELERKVAVKLLHPESSPGSQAEARTRLLREAQAMARLSHPNIVSVHEVGTHQGQVYVAMEFVHGVTLSAWLKRQPRPWREVVEVFRQAASGLAAAHEAGLVHRDFKPQNAMVGDDGRVRVLDFGLARADGDPHLFADLEVTSDPRQASASASGAPTGESLAGLRALDTSLTVTGSLIGTPAYMAPEQFRGERADPRCDQFALCVALYEALFRQRPFPGDTLAELMRAVLAGHLRDPGGSKVPRGLRLAVLRGLQTRPEHRFPTMDAFIAAIDRVVEPRRGAWLAAAGLTAALGGASMSMLYQTGLNEQVCRDRGAQQMAAVWSPERAEAIGAALLRADPTAGEAWAAARPRFDAYAARWVRGAAEACVATEVRRELSPTFYRLRQACLDERLQALSATLGLFDRPDGGLAVHASDIAAGLAPLDDCDDPIELQRRRPPPEDPELAQALASARADLARAEAHRRAGQFTEALASLDALAQAPGVDPLRPEIELTRGRVLVDAGRPRDALAPLQAAYFAALEASHDRLAITAAIELIALTSVHLADFTSAERWVRHAEALLDRGAPAGLAAALAEAQGQLSLATGRYADAHGHFQRAIAIYEQILRTEPEHLPELSALLRLAADVATQLGEFDQAERHIDRSLAALRQRLCDPEFAAAHPLDYRGLVAPDRDAHLDVAAERCCHRHPDFAAALRSAGLLALRRDDDAVARALFERARQGVAGVLPDDSPFALQLTVSLVEAMLRGHDVAGAERAIREALAAAAEARRGLASDARPLHPDMFRLRLALAQVLQRRGELAAAEAEARATIDEAESAWGEDEPYIATALEDLANIVEAAGRPEEALVLAEHAYTLAAARGDRVQPSLRYSSAFRFARALADAGEDERAFSLAEEARTLAAAASDVRAVASVDAWLVERRSG